MWKTMKKTEDTSEQNLKKIFGIKPGEINIILSRAKDLITGEIQGKTKRDVAIEILEVLERSFMATQFIGLGIKDNYKLYKGFSVRNGDRHDDLPQPDQEITIEPKDSFLSWTTDLTTARESAVNWNQSLGDPIGGIVIRTDVDATKILFDVNAVATAVKKYYKFIQQYNASCAPGMVISKKNIEYFSKEAPMYTGDYSIIVSSSIVNCIVEDSWEMSQSGPKWRKNDMNNDEMLNESEQRIHKFLEDVEFSKTQDEIIALQEGFMNFMSKLTNTVRGLTLKYLEALVKKYDTQYRLFQVVAEHAKQVGDNKLLANVQRQMVAFKQLAVATKGISQRVSQDSGLSLNFGFLGG